MFYQKERDGVHTFDESSMAIEKIIGGETKCLGIFVGKEVKEILFCPIYLLISTKSLNGRDKLEF